MGSAVVRSKHPSGPERTRSPGSFRTGSGLWTLIFLVLIPKQYSHFSSEYSSGR